MGQCYTSSHPKIYLNIKNGNDIDPKNAFSRRRSKLNQSMMSKRTSIFAFNNENITDIYVIKDTLGAGFFGTVKLAHLKDNPNQVFAVKSIDKLKFSDDNIQTLENEIKTLSSVDHPNIVRYYETYNDERFFHIVTEYLSGGDLLEGMARKKNYTEKDIAQVINKILNGICHIHSLGIVHRDLKPENIIFENQSETSDIKIIDFGVSRKFFKNNEELNSIVGTPYYVAPEVLDGKYDKKVDIWSIGIIMYVLMTGKPPFNAQSKNELFEKIKNQDLPLPKSRNKNHFSENSVDLLSKLTNKNPKERYSANDALKHPWFEILKTENKEYISKEILENLKNFVLPNMFQRSLIKLIVKKLKTEQLEKLKKAFEILDKDNTGYIDSDKLELAFHNLDLPVAKEEISEIMKNCNLNYGLSNRVNYTSFITAAINKKELFDNEILWDFFNSFGPNENKLICMDNIIKGFNRTGKIKPEKDIIKMFEEIGVSKDTLIDFDKFKQILSKNLL